MKKILLSLSVVLLAIACNNASKNKLDAKDSEAAASGQGVELTVDTKASEIAWIGSKVGGEHNGTIALKEGKLTMNGDSVVAGSFIIDMNSIVDKDLTDAKMNEMLVNHLKSPDFFDVQKYPESSFVITKVEAVKNDSVTHIVSGNLKMKDVEKNISFGVKVSKDGEGYKATSVPFSIDRTQWNVQYGSKSVFKNLKDKIVNDNIQLQITIASQPAKQQ